MAASSQTPWPRAHSTKLGMKNWMFFGSLEAGTNNALFHILLANCRAHDLDAEYYLIAIIKRRPFGVTLEQVAPP